MNKAHIPIMIDEMLQFFKQSQLRIFVDSTIGAGGHAEAILRSHPEIQLFIGIDQDPEALDIARKILHPWDKKVRLVNRNFADLDEILAELDIDKVDGFFLI